MSHRNGNALKSERERQGEAHRGQDTADHWSGVHRLPAAQRKDSELEGEHQRPYGTLATEDDAPASHQVSGLSSYGGKGPALWREGDSFCGRCVWLVVYSW